MSNELESKNVSRLFFKFAIPSIVGMLIVSIQMMVDGIFIANTQGASGLAAINLSMPIILFTNSIALMIAAGGGVYCSIALGKGKFKRANEIMSFTLQIFVIFLGSLSLLGFLFINGIIGVLGATEILAPLVKSYLLTMLILNIPYNIPIFTEGFIKIAGKPNLVFLSCIICLTGNVLMDYLFIVKMDMGVFGAALATSIANGTAGAVLMWNYFKNRSRLKLVKPNGNRILLGKILYNGSSEMLTMVSSALATFIFNYILIRRIGEIGVSALTIVFYVNTVVNICLFGLSQALQPIVSYNLGARRMEQIYKVMRTAFFTGGSIGFFFFFVMKFNSSPIIKVFSKDNSDLMNLTGRALNFVVFQYLFSFVNVIISSFLTAVEKPMESAAVAMCRSLICVAGLLFILPIFLGEKGLWLALPLGELLCMVMSIPLLVISYKKIKIRITKNLV